MAMGPERSKPLHNFTLPCGLKWGNQRFLRCAKVDSNGEISALHRRSYASDSIGKRKNDPEPAERLCGSNVKASAPATENGRKFRYGGGGGGDGIAAVREKLMFDLQAEADKMKDAILREGFDQREIPPAAATTTVPAPTSETWNLRTRRAACKSPTAGGGESGGGLKVDVVKNNALSSPPHKSPRLRSGFTGVPLEKRERAKFSVAITRKEMEEDFMAMVGHRPPRRPKKRAKLVQKNLDTLFPGLWLTEVTADLYKVPDDQ